MEPEAVLTIESSMFYHTYCQDSFWVDAFFFAFQSIFFDKIPFWQKITNCQDSGKVLFLLKGNLKTVFSKRKWKKKGNERKKKETKGTQEGIKGKQKEMKGNKKKMKGNKREWKENKRTWKETKGNERKTKGNERKAKGNEGKTKGNKRKTNH